MNKSNESNVTTENALTKWFVINIIKNPLLRFVNRPTKYC